MKPLEELRKIIITEIGFDPAEKSRKRGFVDAKKIYFYIAVKEIRKHTITNIGKSIKYDHATVLHHLRDFEALIKTEKDLRDNYYKVLDVFRKNTELLNTKELIIEIEKTELRLQSLKDQYDKKLLTSN